MTPLTRRTFIAAAGLPLLAADDSAERLRRFNEAKFGMFIHWGPYSLASVEASWPIMGQPRWNISEEEYRALQAVGEFDTTTSSWVLTPVRIRDLGGALFCDRRYDTVFTYHNGAESYYAARGFRCAVRV